jgi:hypothetical protein
MDSWQLEGMTCLSSDKVKTQIYWAMEAYKLISETEVHRHNLEICLKKQPLLRLSRERIKKMSALLEEQSKIYQKMLSPMGWRTVDENAYLSYLQQNPGSSFLARNMGCVFRDWCWGKKENQISLDILCELAQKSSLHEISCLVLGAGAGRLAADLQSQLKFSKMTLLDHNPFLLMVAKKMIEGESISLVEFPIVPQDADSFAKKQELVGLPLPLENTEFILADLLDESLAFPQVDWVVTPWLVDVIQIDFSSFTNRINQLIPVGGYWMNFGPLGFNNPQLNDYYSIEEVKHIVSKEGFEIELNEYVPIPYMQSPLSNSHRTERVFGFRAKKLKNVDQKPLQFKEELPWESDPDQAIEIPVKEMRLKMGFEFNAFVCSLVEKSLSFREICDQVASQYQIPSGQITPMVHNVLRDIHLRSLANPLDHS